MNIINLLLRYIKVIIIATLTQLIGLLGFFFLSGFILLILSKMTRKLFQKAGFLRLDIYFTGWLGTPVHEIGHAIFCLIFVHKIENISLFTPNNYGSLGHVNHSYNPNNYYQNVGNFFIGVGPIIFGVFIIYGIMYCLLPNNIEIIKILSSSRWNRLNLSNIFNNCALIVDYSLSLLKKIFSSSNYGHLTFWLFLYFSLCVASHMELSLPDIKGMWKGLFFIIIIMLAINSFFLVVGYDVSSYLIKLNYLSGNLITLFIFAIVISLSNLLFTFIILTIIYFFKYKKFLLFS